ncbi:MAG: hypothetical protein WBD55_05780 [Dehalococcoidia bacterium]
MAWTIAKPPLAGHVLLAGDEVELDAFHEVTFEAIDPPSSILDEEIRERLLAAHGYFQVNGEVSRELSEAFAEGKSLSLSFESRGAQVQIDVTRLGDITRVLLHESGIIGTQFPFAVTGPVTIAASQPADV